MVKLVIFGLILVTNDNLDSSDVIQTSSSHAEHPRSVGVVEVRVVNVTESGSL